MPVQKNRRKSQRLTETFLIYESAEDCCWIAHSLRTDQIGTGDCVVEALVDGMRAVDGLVALSFREKDITVFREAPQDILQMAKKAERLPKELYEIAHRKLYGQWPDYVKVNINVPPSRLFTAEAIEQVKV